MKEKTPQRVRILGNSGAVLGAGGIVTGAIANRLEHEDVAIYKLTHNVNYEQAKHIVENSVDTKLMVGGLVLLAVSQLPRLAVRIKDRFSRSPQPKPTLR